MPRRRRSRFGNTNATLVEKVKNAPMDFIVRYTYYGAEVDEGLRGLFRGEDIGEITDDVRSTVATIQSHHERLQLIASGDYDEQICEFLLGKVETRGRSEGDIQDTQDIAKYILEIFPDLFPGSHEIYAFRIYQRCRDLYTMYDNILGDRFDAYLINYIKQFLEKRYYTIPWKLADPEIRMLKSVPNKYETMAMDLMKLRIALSVLFPLPGDVTASSRFRKNQSRASSFGKGKKRKSTKRTKAKK